MPPLKVGECVIDKIKDTMQKNGMFPERAVLVGLSGGADSVALLHIMHRLSCESGFVVYAAHVNHGLRGDDAVRDAEFSKQFCDSLGIPCFIKNADVRALAKEWGISEEMAGRRVRYDFFDELMLEYGIDFTATAHHRNDNAETIVMNFIRGSATAGLCGIPYKRGNYIRPLLDVSREEIENYCGVHSLQYVTDKTNLDTVYTRNKIRNIFIPQIEKGFNPNFCETITANAQIIRDDEAFLTGTAENEYRKTVKDGFADTQKIMNMHKAVARRVIRMMIADVSDLYDVSSVVVENIYKLCSKNKTGTVCNVTKNIVARIEYGKLVISYTEDECEDFAYKIKIGESRYISETGYTVEVSFADEKDKEAECFMLPDGVDFVTVTNRRKGDRFVPSGMSGSKSVKEYMINEKIPKNLRSRIGILRIGDNIAWIIGYRRDERFKFQKNGIKIKIIY